MAINAYKSYVILKSSEKLETIFNDEEYTVDCILKKITCLKVNDIAELIAAIKYLETWTEQHKVHKYLNPIKSTCTSCYLLRYF